MAVTYAWTFAPFVVMPSVGALANVVKEVPYTLSATDGTSTASVSGSVALGNADVISFVPFASLTTPAQAIAWVTAALNVPQMQADLAARVAALTAAGPLAAPVTMKPPFLP